MTPLPTHPPCPFTPAPGAWLPPAAFELLAEKYAPPECGADGEKSMVANKVLIRTRLGTSRASSHPTFLPPLLQVLALVARKFPAMCKAVRENACQGFCNDQCPAGSKKQAIDCDASRTRGAPHTHAQPHSSHAPLLPPLLRR